MNSWARAAAEHVTRSQPDTALRPARGALPTPVPWEAADSLRWAWPLAARNLQDTAATSQHPGRDNP